MPPPIRLWTILLDVMEWALDQMLDKLPVHQPLGLAEEATWLPEGPALVLMFLGQFVDLRLFVLFVIGQVALLIAWLIIRAGMLVRRFMWPF